MSRLEERLLETMTVRRWLVALALSAVLFGAVGWFSGRAVMRREIRSFAGFANVAGIQPTTPAMAEGMKRAEGQVTQLEDWMRIRKEMVAAGKSEAEIKEAQAKHIDEWAAKKK